MCSVDLCYHLVRRFQSYNVACNHWQIMNFRILWPDNLFVIVESGILLLGIYW